MVLLVLAVIVDSAVTLFVGWRLARTARETVTTAAERLAPIMAAELRTSARSLMAEMFPGMTLPAAPEDDRITCDL